MGRAQLRNQIAKAWVRCGAYLSESFRLSAEAGFYPDPLHLGPVLGVLYSSEGSEERRGRLPTDDTQSSSIA